MDGIMYLLMLLMLRVKQTRGDGGFPIGYCQVFSYNINLKASHLQEKHYFVCCNNLNEKTCQDFTYQKPSRTESFCAGQVIQQEGSHWTQMETALYPGNGRFYCGGCCGQHHALDACNKEMASHQQQCTNWAQCFQRECRNILAAVSNHKQLKCTVPPAPHPKHYHQDTRTLPANLSLQFMTPPSSVLSHIEHNVTCGREWCNNLDINTRCRYMCCQPYCCLQDGPQGNTILILGLSTTKLVGIIIGSVFTVIIVVIMGLLIARRCAPTCDSIKVPTNDTHILVIEGPEQADSDPE